MKLPLAMSTTIFFLIILISAPFFQVQTKQDGINRVLANDFQPFSSDFQINNVNFTSHTGFVSPIEFSSLFAIPSSKTIIFPIQPNRSYKITRTGGNRFAVAFNNSGLSIHETPIFNYFRDDTIFEYTFIENDYLYAYVYVTWDAIVEVEVLEIIDSIETRSYYEIMENARTAEYSNIDGFMGTIYALPEYANRLYQYWARFTTPTDLLPDSINPLKIVDEQTGRYRDITYDEIQSNWLLRFFGRFVNFTEEFIAGE